MDQEKKPINPRIKKYLYDNIILSVLVSLAMTAVFAGIAFIFVWSHRMEVVKFLVQEYKSEQKDATQVQIPAINKEEEPEEKVETQIVVPQEEKIQEAPTIVGAVKKAKPAVVSVVLTSQTSGRQIGSGSGFLISSNGLIVTNRHVIDRSDANYKVLLNNGKEYDATVLDKDPVLDIAFIRINESNLPYLILGDSDSLEVGQTVIAIGNALGEFENSVSAGVVSGLSRTIMADDGRGQSEYLDKVIQTDAAINKGNSGGPLLNIKGEVVGINVAMAIGSSSIGFSLPINGLKDVINGVKQIGKIIRPYVGVRYVLVTPEMNLPYGYGFLIKRGTAENDLAILPNSPAEKAGLKEGDIILEIDGEQATGSKDFAYLIRGKKVGDLVAMRVYSNGIVKTVIVVLGTAPDNL